MKWFNSLVQALVARLYSQVLTARFKQRGASALEYIVLAAVIVIAVAVGAALLVGTSAESGPIYDTFNNIKDCVEDGANCGDD